MSDHLCQHLREIGPARRREGAPGWILLDDRLKVRRVLDPLPAIVAADVLGEDLRAPDDPHSLSRGEHFELAAYMHWRDGVVVEIEVHIGRLADPDRDPLLARKGQLRQRQQPRALLQDQRFRSDLGLYVHLHLLVTDGAFEECGDELPFRAAPPPTPERMTAILGRVQEILAAAGHDADDLDLDPALAAP